MATYSEPLRPYEFILQDSGIISYDDVTIASGAGELVPGSVIGLSSKRQAAAPIPTIVGTGTGLMSALSFGPDVQVGSYVVTLLATSATAAFSVVAPDGTALPNGAVGTAYKSSHINFSIANGGTMTTGDAYTVVVTAGGTPVLVGTGTGVVSGFSIGPKAMNGTYKVQLTTTSATSPLVITAPDGSTLPNGAVASAYTSDHINFTLSNAGTMTAGDYFNIVVANGTGKAALFDPTASDGTQMPYGIITHGVDATSADVAVTAFVRLGLVKKDVLTFKSTVTAAQKDAAYKAMLTNFVVARD
jgi:hypothetical protein